MKSVLLLLVCAGLLLALLAQFNIVPQNKSLAIICAIICAIIIILVTTALRLLYLASRAIDDLIEP